MNFILATGSLCFGRQKLLLVVTVVTLVFSFYQLSVFRFPLKDPFGFGWTEQCQPKSSVAFLKTHKTAGSTVQNVFLRYADKHNLLLVLPRSNNYIGHPDPIQRYMVPRLKKNSTYSILCHHTRFNYAEIRRLLPSDAVFITIVRDPAPLFESLYSYYRLNGTFNMSLVDFARAGPTYKKAFNQRFYRRIGRNQMSFDLGLSEDTFEDKDLIAEFIRSLDAQFQLVMVAERMDESMILLRHLLCWDISDVVTFRHNVRLASMRPPALDEEVVRGLRSWNAADQELYDYFTRKLQSMIDEFGRERMEREVAELRSQIDHWYNFCVEDQVRSHKLENKFKSHSSKVLGFKLRPNVTDQTCENLAKAELPYTNELRLRQLPHYIRSWSPYRRPRASGAD